MKNFIRSIAAFAIAAACAGAFAQAFGPEIRLSNNAGPSVTPNIAVAGSNVYVVWSETVGAQAEVYYSRSTNGGVSFSPASNLSNNGAQNDGVPQIAAAGSQVVVFWTNDNEADIFVRVSTDSGATFAPTVPLTSPDGAYSRPTGPLIDASGNIHFVWYDNRSVGYGQIYYTCSASGGGSFSAPVNITAFDGVVDNEMPRLAQGTDGTLYMTFRSSRDGQPLGGWPPYEQYVMRTSGPVTTCNPTWLRPAQRVSKGLPEEYANKLGGGFVAGANDVLHLAYWSHKAGNNLIYQRGAMNGNGWSQPLDISQFGLNHPQWNGGNVEEMQGFGLGEDASGGIHVAYGQFTGSTEGFDTGPVLYRTSTNNGVSWSGAVNVSTNTSTTAEPRAAYGNGKFHVVWMDWRDGNSGAEIYYRNLTPGASGAKLTDLNGDGKSDLLYRNTSTGQVWRVLMNGFTTTSSALAYTEPNTAWKIVADADFTGDGISDALWRNTTTGQVFVQNFGSNGMPAGGGIIYTEPNAAWHIVATPDFDGDGKSDLVWWNSTTGQVYGMLVNGFSLGAQGLFYTEPNTNWKIVGSGDFAGSGKKNQLLWRNSATGQVYLMTVNVSGGVFSQSGVMIYNEPNLNWIIAGVGDFNGDGKSDILYRNTSTNQLYMLLMNGPSVIGAGVVYTAADSNWKVVSTGDYNGDGKADILYRNYVTGGVYLLTMNGLTITGSGFVYNEPNLNWLLMGPLEYFP